MDDPKTDTNLPAGLAEQFAKLERSLFAKESTIAVLGALLVLIIAWAIAFASDRFWDTPIRFRSVLLGATVIGMLGCAVAWLRNWRWDRRDERALSRIIQMTQRRLGDRLLGAVELADGDLKQGLMSPALRRAAIDQVANSSRDFDFATVVDQAPARRITALFTLVAVAAIATVVIAPKASWSSLARLVAPFVDTPRFTFVTLSDLPRELIVQHGDEFVVQGKVNYHGFWKPAQAKIRFEEQAELTIPVTDQSVTARLEGQTMEGTLHIKIGDAEAAIEIFPTHPPVLGKLQADVAYPEYLGYPKTNLTFSGPTLTVVEGSTVGLSTTASRELAGVRLEMEGTDPVDIPIAGASFETPSYQPAGELRGSIHIEDQLGLTNASPRHFALRTRIDDPPIVQLLDLPAEVSILESDVLPLKLFAQDDYGVKMAGVAWNVEGLSATNQPAVREFQNATSNRTEIEYTNTYIFSPTVLGVPPDSVVEVRAAAADYHPDHEPAQSLRHRIHIVGNIRHAKAVRDQLEALFSQLEEITREEEAVAQKTGEIKNRDAQETSDDQDSRDIDATALKQEKNNRHLNDIAKGGRRILEEAMRNPAINQKTLKEWTENVSAMESLAKNEMRQSAQSLRQAQQEPGKPSGNQPAQQAGNQSQSQSQKQNQNQQGSNGQQSQNNQANQSKRDQQLAQAQDAQQQALQKLQDMQRKMNDGLDNLEALTLAQRLQQLADEEEGLVTQLRAVITETIGLKPYELQERHRMMNQRLSGDQGDLGKDSGTIRDEIGRFFDRTQRPKYGAVHTEMKDTKVETELGNISELINGNIAMETMQNLNDWTIQLKQWAKMLEPPTEDGGSGSGSGKQQNQEQQKLLRLFITLLRTRLNEVNLHHRTRLLHDAPGTQEKHQLAAERLADDQRSIRGRFSQVQMENEFDEFTELLAEAQTSMSESEYTLLEPETGEPVQQAQMTAIQHLSDLINLINEQSKRRRQNQQQQQQQSPAERQAAQQMQMLMQIARQQMRTAFARIPGMNPGGNPSGGGTGQAGRMNGEAVGAGDPDREGDRASATGTQIPTEFREIMELYFKAKEQQEQQP